MSYVNFQVGEKFPLVIKAAGDGGIFQYDINGAIFILKLSKVDIIAIEAFRTGKIEIGLFFEKDVIFLLYKIDGIINGWADSPYTVHFHEEKQLPNLDSCEKTLNLYLVHSQLDTLLSMRTEILPDEFFAKLVECVKEQQKKQFNEDEYVANINDVWNKYSSEEMYEKAIAKYEIKFDINAAKEISTQN